ncbi:acetyl-CoA C-acyltransferase [Paenibacillus taiwanensis]|uniref:acetyl-CoA C-acyltransferase n=1 Tax=Paenibacillus taiwanensis TaxID=401638 RepID=UPI00041A0D42|nr:acetyl-CoA C-acyltransferase [Paenibacillus taiwanensis]
MRKPSSGTRTSIPTHREAVIVAVARTAVGKAKRGALAETRAEDMGRAVIEAVLERASGVSREDIDDVILGCAMPEGEQGLNVARIIALYAGLPSSVPAVTVNRFCSSGLQAIAYAAEQIQSGSSDIVIAGGVESMSHVPMTGFKLAPHPRIADEMPEVYIGMGHTAERVAALYGISREQQDAFALNSHRKAAAAQAAGLFNDEIVPVQSLHSKESPSGHYTLHYKPFEHDECVRSDTSMEALSRLKPSFAAKGTVTAGNSSPVSDGAAAVLVMSRERAEALGLEPLATYRGFTVAGVAPEVMGIGPVEAIPKLLRQVGLDKKDIQQYEINEAFAAQCLAIIKQLELDEAQINVNGGAIALGHPLGCTGAKLTTSLVQDLRRKGGGFGIVSMCIGGGMGAAGLFEVHAPKASAEERE